MEAIILAGGLGKRLRPLTENLPKCMLKVGEKTLLDYNISLLKKYNVKKIIVTCGFKWEKIKEHYGNRFIYSIETEPLGTGGVVKQALKYVNGREFFLLNADDITNIDLKN